MRNEIGYVPPDARDRLQGEEPQYAPPFNEISPLPKDHKDPANNKPNTPLTESPMIAPRVVTHICEPEIPDEVDYMIIGSEQVVR